MKKFLLLALTLIWSVSCAPIPHTTEVSPEVKGRVIDAVTGKPVAGAQLTYIKGSYSDTATSKEDGSFDIGPLTQWHYLLFIGSPGHFPAPIRYACISEPGIIMITNANYNNGKYDVYIDGKKHENIIIKMLPKYKSSPGTLSNNSGEHK